MAIRIPVPGVSAPDIRRSWERWWSKLAPYFFISPFYILFLVFSAFPILFSAYISLTNWEGVRPYQFVGLDNYRVLFGDPSFGRSLVNIVIIALGFQPIFLFLSLLFAVLLNNTSLRFRGFFRTVYFLPVVTSLVVVGLVFTMLLDPKYGLVNAALTSIGVPTIHWLDDPKWMRVVIILALIWRWTGYEMVIMLAGLQSIPLDMYEAAKVDGANTVQSFLQITVPLMQPVILFCVVLSTIGTFNIFDEAYVFFNTSGGSQEAGLVPGVFLYRAGFTYFRFGYASAFAYVLGAIIVFLSVIQLRLGRERG
jgi:lactose/L-arabinose transport system permease protein